MKSHRPWILVFFVGLTLFQGCTTSHKNSCEVAAQAKGFGFSPLGFPVSYDMTTQFFEDVEALKDGAIMWNGSWRDDAVVGSDAGEIPVAAKLIQDSAVQYCYVPISVFGWRSGTTNLIQIPSNMVNDWTNTDARDQYISMLKEFVEQYHPPYVFLGNENDFYYETSTADYAHWLIAYNMAYDAIKVVSPETLVGPVFNYEHMSGQGELNGWTAEFWPALDNHDFDKIDIVGLTLYPFFQYENPEDVPSNYLQPLFDKIGSTPIIITETGWPAENLGGLDPIWITTEEAQVEYVSRLQAMVSGHDVPVMNWLFFYGMVNDGTDSDAWKIFGSVSIKDSLGNEYQVYNTWTDL